MLLGNDVSQISPNQIQQSLANDTKTEVNITKSVAFPLSWIIAFIERQLSDYAKSAKASIEIEWRNGPVSTTSPPIFPTNLYNTETDEYITIGGIATTTWEIVTRALRPSPENAERQLPSLSITGSGANADLGHFNVTFMPQDTLILNGPLVDIKGTSNETSVNKLQTDLDFQSAITSALKLGMTRDLQVYGIAAPGL